MPPTTIRNITVRFMIISPLYLVRLVAKVEKPALQNAETEVNNACPNALKLLNPYFKKLG